MSIGRRWIGFLTALVLTVCAVFLCARPLVLEWLSVLDRGTGLQSYQAAAVGEEGAVLSLRLHIAACCHNHCLRV